MADVQATNRVTDEHNARPKNVHETSNGPTVPTGYHSNGATIVGGGGQRRQPSSLAASDRARATANGHRHGTDTHVDTDIDTDIEGSLADRSPKKGTLFPILLARRPRGKYCLNRNKLRPIHVTYPVGGRQPR